MSRIEPATATPPGLVQTADIRNEFSPPAQSLRIAQDTAYRQLVAGTTRRPDPVATLALPGLPLLLGRRLHAIWPVEPAPPAARSEETKGALTITTSPGLYGADGTKISFPAETGGIYTLLQTPGSRLNGIFQRWGDGRSALQHLGLLLMTPNGYSRIHIGPNRASEMRALVNGIPLQVGQSIRLANGGLLHASRNAQHFYIRSPKNYVAAMNVHRTPYGPLLSLHLSSMSQRAKNDLTPMTGLLAPTFQTAARPRAIDSFGEKYAGSLAELRVHHGLFGSSPQSPRSELLVTEHKLGTPYQYYFGLDPERPFTSLEPQEITEQWEWLSQQAVHIELIQNAAARERKLKEQERKQELLLAAALKGGHIDLAILLLSATETQSANDLTRRLVGRIHQLQKQRQTLSAQMSQVGQKEGAEGTSQLQSLVTQSSNIATEISLLQTFLQDAIASKRNIQEFASNWIQQSHQTTRSIIQSIGR